MLKKKIFTPGPTQVHPEVLKAVVSNFTYHRSDGFREFHKQLVSKLKEIIFTKNHVNILTASGTGAMEAAVCNFCEPGEKVLFVNQGKFGERWGIICKVFGISAQELRVTYGDSVTLEYFKDLDLRKFSAVFLTHSETSTAALTDIKQLTTYIKSNSGALVIVDAISSIGTIEFRMDNWKVDVAITASQKGFMTPPGLSVIAYNNSARDKMMRNTNPRFYLDLRKLYEAQRSFSTNWTPALGVMYGLDKASDLILTEGIEKRWQKVNKMAQFFRDECKSYGFGIYPKLPADSLTAITLPEDIPTGKLVKLLSEKYGIQIANGQADIGLKDKIARISHMGDLDLDDTAELLDIIKKEFKLMQKN